MTGSRTVVVSPQEGVFIQDGGVAMVGTVDRPRVAYLDVAVAHGVLEDVLECWLPVLLVVARSVCEYEGEGIWVL